MARSGSVERDGFTLDWVQVGGGIPMLIVGPPRYYQRVFPEDLHSTFDVVFANMRGWGSLPEGFDATTITRDTFSDDIEAMGQAAGLVRPVVVGHSIVGKIVLEYARRYPDSVRGVAVIGTTPIGSVQSEPRIWEFFEHDADTDRKAAHQHNLATRRNPATITTGRDFADQYIANGAFYWYDPTFDASPLWEGLDPDWQVLNHVGTLYADYELAPLDVPVFLGLGRFDYTAPYHLWDDEQRHRLPRLDYVLYDKSGHTPPYEEPQRFTADMAAWATTL